MLWSIFVIYTITHHGLGGFSGLINGLIAAANGAFSMLTSEPTAKRNVKRTRMSVLSIRDIIIIIIIIANYTSNNGMYIKRDNVRIKRIILDLRDVIADSKKVVFFEYEMPA